MEHWLSPDFDYSFEQYLNLIELAEKIKAMTPEEAERILSRKNIYLMFFNQSIRTRSSFVTGINKLGGNSLILDPYKDIYKPAQKGKEVAYSTERVSDVARVLSEYGDAIGVRMYGEPVDWIYGEAHAFMQELAEWSSIPIINMECDKYHPCQALADVLTIKELLGGFKRKKIAITWAYSESWHKPVAVPQSLLLATAKLGMDIELAYPEGFDLDPQVVDRAKEFSGEVGGNINISNSMESAVEDADIVYAKSWCSLDFLPTEDRQLDEASMVDLLQKNTHWVCDDNMMSRAKESAKYMHCLPCDRGQEVTDSVVDGEQSAVFHQAGNRLHAQNAIMAHILGNTMDA